MPGDIEEGLSKIRKSSIDLSALARPDKKAVTVMLQKLGIDLPCAQGRPCRSRM